MVRLVEADPGSPSDDMLLAVDRVEDARTITELLRIPAAHWQELLRTEVRHVAPGDVEGAYGALRDFWDWLATSFANLPPDVPMSPGPGWLRARYHDWQSRS